MPRIVILGPDLDLISDIITDLKKKIPKADLMEAHTTDELDLLIEKCGGVDLVMADPGLYRQLRESKVEYPTVIKYSPKRGVYDKTLINQFLKNRRARDVHNAKQS